MSQIAPQRPPYTKTAILTDKEEERYRKSFRGRDCELCGEPDDGTVVGCHINARAGGTAWKVPGAIIAAHATCHDIIDGRAGSLREQVFLLKAGLRRLATERARKEVE